METKTVTLKNIDSEVWKQIKVMAIQEGVTVPKMIEKMVVYWYNCHSCGVAVPDGDER